MKNLKQYTKNAIEFTRFITTKWNDRLTGSKACLETGEYLHEQFSKFSDKQFKQEFTTHPGAFLGFIRVCIVFFFINLLGLFTENYWLSFIVSLASLFIFVFQFFLYYEILEPFFPKKKSQNIYAFLEPENDVQQQIIISAHHDSAHVFNFYEKNPQYYGIRVNLGIGGMFLAMLIATASFLLNSLNIEAQAFIDILKYLSLSLIVVVLPLWFFYNPKKGTPGAGDNIICTAVTFEILKHFYNLKQQKNGLKNTRVIIGSWDAEEAGLRGAKAFVKKHKKLLHSVPTYNYNLECLYNHKEMNFTTSDVNSFVPLSQKMANECVEVCKKLGYNIPKVPFPILAGGTDAGEFARGGIEAITLNGMAFGKINDNPSYHTTRDTVDKVDPIAVSRSIHIGIEYILKKDMEI